LNSRELIRQNENLIVIHEKLERAFGLYNTQQKILIASFISILLLIVAVVLTWQAVRQTRKAHRQMKAMHDEQSRFYTNASHQLKTPLTLIAGPMKELADSRTLQDKERALVDIVCRNVSTLESLVSSVLNFRKEMKNMVSDETAGEATMQVASSELIQERRLAMMKHEDTDELSSILIVDDNDDMCLYLKTLLADQFYVLLASNGQDGLKIARELVPDIIVSDVMMPVMDGLQFCRQLKENAITSHIPVILLTARSSDSQQMEGYEHGADAYLTKPFNADVLISRIYNLLKNRQQLLHLFDNQQTAQQSQAASTQDTLFAEQLREAIRKHMSNSSLKMDDLADEVGLGRVQLYRKVKALTGLSPVEVLRQMRLQHARTLLMTTTKTVQEIAYDVGFGTPGYFSKCFKQQYGIYPMDLRSQQN
jgi:DNA-binding response OmpR family regulator